MEEVGVDCVTLGLRHYVNDHRGEWATIVKVSGTVDEGSITEQKVKVVTRFP